MIDDEAESRLKQILAEVFELEPSTIDARTSSETVERWDSLQHFSMIVSVEQEFGVRFSDEEMGELLSYDRLWLALAGKLSANGHSVLEGRPSKAS